MDIGAIHGGASPSYLRFQQRADARVKGGASRRSEPLTRVAVRCSYGGEGEAPVSGLMVQRCKGDRSAVCQRTVRTLMIVVIAPGREFLLRIGQREEQFHVQTFISQSAMKALHKAILHRLAWPD